MADSRTVSTAALAYLGDGAYELLVRERLVEEGHGSSKSLNVAAKKYVPAPCQAAAMEKLLPFLSEEESAVFHRGRNLGHSNTPKNATVAEYRNATGMEALFGFLQLTGQKERMQQLFDLAFPQEENN